MLMAIYMVIIMSIRNLERMHVYTVTTNFTKSMSHFSFKLLLWNVGSKVYA